MDVGFANADIQIVENRFCALATNAKRYTIKNGNNPNIGNVTEEKESELEEFVDYAKVIMGVLGHKVFEPLALPILEAVFIARKQVKTATK